MSIKPILKRIVSLITIFSFVFIHFIPLPLEAGHSRLSAGSVIKGRSHSSVYYVGDDGKRYVFPNRQTYFSWYDDFNGVIDVDDDTLAEYPVGSNVRYRPGVLLVKIQSDPKVYAVSANGFLRWIQTEGVAEELYGENWNLLVDDIPVTFFTNYEIGASVSVAADFDPDEEENNVPTINENRLRRLGQKLDQLEESIDQFDMQSRLCRQFEKRYERLQKRFERRGLTIPDLSSDFSVACPNGSGNSDDDDDDDNDDDDDKKDKKKKKKKKQIFIGKKVAICHTPPGNAGSAHTIIVGKAAARAHLSHGDTPGRCEDGDAEQDTTPPVITDKTTTSTPTTTMVTWKTDEVSTSAVKYATSSLTTASSTEIASDSLLVTSHKVTLTGLTASTTYHFIVMSVDASGNIATSTEMTFTTLSLPLVPDTEPPVISGVSATSTATSTKVTWTTNEGSTSKVTYADSSLDTATSTTMVSDGAFVTSHELTLTGLATSTQYFYMVGSEDSSGNVATTTEQTFTTN